ncbi:MAG: 16S rRNA (guanine(966)-N(2))-methyltransferase RsmD [Dehalococcoidia bacterium]
MPQRIRITGGELRGFVVSSASRGTVRPTTALVREAVFNMIGARIVGARVLDLFAGTGALGLEAISRGASRVVLVESDPRACQAIRDTLARAGVADRGEVVQARLPGGLGRIEGTFDLVLMDPPYDGGAGDLVLAGLGPFVAPGGLVVYEHRSSYNPPERPPDLRQVQRRVYGDSAVAFYTRQEGQ